MCNYIFMSYLKSGVHKGKKWGRVVLAKIPQLRSCIEGLKKQSERLSAQIQDPPTKVTCLGLNQPPDFPVFSHSFSTGVEVGPQTSKV